MVITEKQHFINYLVQVVNLHETAENYNYMLKNHASKYLNWLFPPNVSFKAILTALTHITYTC